MSKLVFGVLTLVALARGGAPGLLGVSRKGSMALLLSPLLLLPAGTHFKYCS